VTSSSRQWLVDNGFPDQAHVQVQVHTQVHVGETPGNAGKSIEEGHQSADISHWSEVVRSLQNVTTLWLPEYNN
jgi:hypothetical protein